MIFTGQVNDRDMLIVGHHEWWLMFLSIGIAIFTAYMAFYVARLAGNVQDHRIRRFLTVLGGVVMGVGIWAMHFIGMLGFEIDRPIAYDPVTTVLSLIPAIAASIIAICQFDRAQQGWPRLMLTGTLFGAGIGAMHYIGMSAVEFNGFIRYDLKMFVLSLIVAVVLAVVALWFLFHSQKTFALGKKANTFLAACVMGLATSGMHYVAMMSSHFYGNEMGYVDNLAGVDPHVVAVVVTLATLMLVGAVLFIVLRESMQQRERHQALSDMEAWYRSIVESAPEGMLVTNDQGVMILVNPVLESIFGYTSDEMLGQKVEMLVPTASRQKHVGLRENYAREGRARQMGAASLELMGQRKDGTTFPVDLSLSVLPANGMRGRCLFAAVRDITDRKLAEQEVLSQRANLQKMLDMAPVGVAITVNGITRFANPAIVAMLGMQVGDPAAKIYLHPEDRLRMREALERDGMYHAEDIPMRGSDGLVKEVMATFVLIDYEDEQGILGWLVDVTTIKHAELAMREARDLAEQATKVKSDFLANMSHEIRTPMNAVIGMTHLLSKTSLDSRQRNYIDKIQQSSQHLLGVINDILDFSKIEAGRMHLEQIDFDLEKVLENVANLISDKAVDKGLELIFDVDRTLPRYFVGDPLRLGQILINYANNAVKFTEHGEIVIIVRLHHMGDDHVQLYLGVKDTGIGLSAEQRDMLYQSFQQADTSTTRKFGGTGLGLVITKRITELMGGEVGVDSQLGVGSTFWSTVRLGKSATVPRPLVLSQDLQGQRVLVVDDNDSARMVLKDLLEQMKFDVSVAIDGQEALQSIIQADRQGLPYQLVMLDWQMPGMDGLEVAKKVHRLELNPHPYCFIVTAYGREELFSASDNDCVSDVLVKPVSASVLFDSIARVIGTDLSMDHAAVVSRPRLALDDQHHLRGARVLLAEDNEINQEVAVALLEEVGLKVEVAKNGQIAVDLAKTGKYDAILMDMQMPVMDGLEATRQIRQLSQCADIPILAMTANVTQADRDRCREAGMNDHIAKPIDPEVLWKTLAKWITPQVQTEALGGDTPATLNKPTVAADGCGVKASPGNKLGSAESILARIDGLDAKEGLRRMLGKTSLYESMLQKFVDGQSDFEQVFRTAIDKGDHPTAQRLAHTLKGVAANIGARTVSEEAASLEQAVGVGQDRHEMSSRLGSLLQRLDALTGSLREYFSLQQGIHPDSHSDRQPRSQPHIDPNQEPDAVSLLDPAMVNQLIKLLNENDAEAVDCFHQIAAGLKREFPLEYVQIEKAIDGFDFEEAHQLLNRAILQR